jgi:NAD-dependent DNA ligase
MEDAFNNLVGHERISNRQVNGLIGIARGIAADGSINQAEVEFLQKWLANNVDISGQPVIRTLYRRVEEILADGSLDDDEKVELLETLGRFADRDFELGEVLKSSSLPLCDPLPKLSFPARNYCFTGTFNYGDRKRCEAAVRALGAEAGPLTKSTHVLVVGIYATDSWKHSAFGNKILKAVQLRDKGHPINIVSEVHWIKHL